MLGCLDELLSDLKIEGQRREIFYNWFKGLKLPYELELLAQVNISMQKTISMIDKYLYELCGMPYYPDKQLFFYLSYFYLKFNEDSVPGEVKDIYEVYLDISEERLGEDPVWKILIKSWKKQRKN